MTATDLRAVLNRFVRTWHARDLEGITAMFAPGFEYVAAMVHVRSPEAMIEMAQGIWSGTPDEHCELINVIVEGNRVAAEVRTTATHSGPLAFGTVRLPATGRRIDVTTAWILRFEGERIARWHEYGDPKDWVEQMGATVTITPAPAG